MSRPRERLSRSRGMRNLQRTTRELQILIQVAYVADERRGILYFIFAAKISNLTLSTQSPREQCSIAALHSSCMQSHKNEHNF